MVNYLEYYAPVLTRAVEICNQLIAFFGAEQTAENDRFARAASEAKTTRNGILERMATPRYLAPKVFRSVVDFMTFYDNLATDDYGVSLSADKLAIRDRLMAAWLQEVVEPLVKRMNQLEEQGV